MSASKKMLVKISVTFSLRLLYAMGRKKNICITKMNLFMVKTLYFFEPSRQYFGSREKKTQKAENTFQRYQLFKSTPT